MGTTHIPLSTPSFPLICPQACLGLPELEEHLGEELRRGTYRAWGFSALWVRELRPGLNQNSQLGSE